MIEFRGSAQQDAYILVFVELDGGGVGSLHMTLGQWDRLKQHRMTEPSREICGGSGVLMFGADVGVKVESD